MVMNMRCSRYLRRVLGSRGEGSRLRDRWKEERRIFKSYVTHIEWVDRRVVNDDAEEPGPSSSSRLGQRGWSEDVEGQKGTVGL